MKISPETLLAELIEAETRYSAALAICRQHGPVVFREARRQLGLTQRQLADLLGVNHTYLSKIEREHQIAGFPVMAKLSEILKERG